MTSYPISCLSSLYFATPGALTCLSPAGLTAGPAHPPAGARRVPLGIIFGVYSLGTLSAVPASRSPELVGGPTLEALTRLGWLETVGVVEIDPALSDTARSQDAYRLPPDSLANCVVVGGKREGEERLAACVVLFTTRADVNGVVRRRLDVRKASFLPTERAVELTGMQYGGINPIGLPAGWPILVDSRVVERDVVLIGSGVRASKLLLPGSMLADIPGGEVVEGLGIPLAPR